MWFVDAGEKVTGVGPLQQFGFETGGFAPIHTLVLSQRRILVISKSTWLCTAMAAFANAFLAWLGLRCSCHIDKAVFYEAQQSVTRVRRLASMQAFLLARHPLASSSSSPSSWWLLSSQVNGALNT